MRILPPLYDTLRFLLLDLQKQLQLLAHQSLSQFQL